MLESVCVSILCISGPMMCCWKPQNLYLFTYITLCWCNRSNQCSPKYETKEDLTWLYEVQSLLLLIIYLLTFYYSQECLLYSVPGSYEWSSRVYIYVTTVIMPPISFKNRPAARHYNLLRVATLWGNLDKMVIISVQCQKSYCDLCNNIRISSFYIFIVNYI